MDGRGIAAGRWGGGGNSLGRGLLAHRESEDDSCFGRGENIVRCKLVLMTGKGRDGDDE